LIFSSIFGSQASITCKSKSASIESSKVEVKASISSGGKSRINQIVSFIKYSLHLKLFFSVASTHIFQTEVQSVANSLSSAKTHFFVREFVKVDFQAFVYQTTQTVFNPFLTLFFLCSALTFM